MSTLKVGDRVLVPVLGELKRATVVEPVSALGNVVVDLEEPAVTEASELPVQRLVRSPDDVHAWLWLDGGTLDVGIIRDAPKWVAFRWTLLRPWRWHRLPRILRRRNVKTPLFWEEWGT